MSRFRLLLIAVLAGCQSSPPLSLAARYSLLFTSARDAELEPRGCHFNPLGGVDREWNARAGLHARGIPELSLQSGALFRPHRYSSADRDLYNTKAKYVLQSLNELKIDVIAADHGDFAPGLDRVRAWRQRSRAEWIGANLFERGSERTLFPPFADRTIGGQHLRIVGLSACQTNQPGAAVECRDPRASLRAALARPAPPGTHWILLASLPLADLRGLLEEAPQLEVFLDSDRAGWQQTGVGAASQPA